jgi:phosphate/sulfate permease
MCTKFGVACIQTHIQVGGVAAVGLSPLNQACNIIDAFQIFVSSWTTTKPIEASKNSRHSTSVVDLPTKYINWA